MNDNELSTVVRDSVAGTRSTTPVDQIVSRGRTMRARRRIPLAAGALAVAGGTALALFAVVPSGQPGHAGSAQLAAWTVSKQANGNIDVTVNELKDPSGLQATLRADGLPVDVNFGLTPDGACQPVPTTQKERQAITQYHARRGFTIDPSALPSGTGLAIFVQHVKSSDPATYLVGTGLIHTSQECTG